MYTSRGSSDTMERPRRSPKKKSDPAFLYGKEKLTDSATESKKLEKVVLNKDVPKTKKSVGVLGNKKDKLSRKKEDTTEKENKAKVSSQQDNTSVQSNKEPAPSPPRSPNNDTVQKLMEEPETIHSNYQVNKEGKKIACNVTFYTKRLDKWIEVIYSYYCEQHKNGLYPQPPSKEKFMGNFVVRLMRDAGSPALHFKFNDKNNVVVVTGPNFQTWKDSDYHEILARLKGPTVKKPDCDETETKSTPSSSRGSTPVPRRSRLSLKGAKEGKAVQKLAPLFNQPKEASMAPDMKSGLQGTVGSKTPTKHREKETVCVAALHNLGNTCFLNSILQILRHTPGFVDKLNVLAKEIKISEKERSLVAELEDEEEEEQVLTWKLVMNIHELFRKMTSREAAVVRGDTKYIAIRPYDLLDTIERLNPMFQGNLQQDAHEFLRCILAYIQEAAKEVNKYRKSIRDAASNEKSSVKSEAEIEEPEFAILNNNEDGPEVNSSKVKGEPVSTETKPNTVTFKVSDKNQKTSHKEDTMLTDNELDDDIRIEPIDFDTKYESDTKSIDSVESVALLEAVPLEYLSPSKIKTAVTVEASPVMLEPVAVYETSTKFTVNANNESSWCEKSSQMDDNNLESSALEDAEKEGEGRGKKRQCRSRLTVKKVKDEDNSEAPESGEMGEPAEEGKQQPVRKLSRRADKKPSGLGDDKTKNSLLKFLKPLVSDTNDTNTNADTSSNTGANTCSTSVSQDENVSEKSLAQDVSAEQTDDSSMDVHMIEPGEEEKPKRGRKRKTSLPPELPDKRRSSRGRSSKSPASNGAETVSRASADNKSSGSFNTSADFATLIEPEAKAEVSSYPKITSMFKPGPGRKRLGIRGCLAAVKAAVNKMENGATVNSDSSTEAWKEQVIVHPLPSGINIVGNGNCEPTCGIKTEENSTISNGVTHAQNNGAEKEMVMENEMGTTPTIDDSCSDDERVRADSPETVRLKSEALEQGKHSVVKLKKLNKVEFTKYCGPDIKPKSILDITRRIEDVVDCVEQLFQGTMAHRTKCLECECYNERKEEYQDISVPVVKKQTRRQQSDESDDEESDEPTAWIVNAMQEVERLRDDNKYRCERCDHLVEAERSMQYPVIPTILTLHLKRFAALNGYFGGFTKNTDYVATPMVLPPVQRAFDDEGRYELYGVVTHSGFSLSSGHYVAYVRAPLGHEPLPGQAAVPRPAPPPALPQSSPPPEQASLQPAEASFSTGEQNNGEMADPNNNADTNNNLDASSPNLNLSPAQDPDTSSPAGPSSANTNPATADVQRYSAPHQTQHCWYECDDDVVAVLSPKDFEQALSPNATGTPYMLFYCKVSN